MAKVRIESPNASEETRELQGPTVSFGRSADCDLVLTGEGISRRHGRFVIETKDSAQWIVEDLGSKNGILVNEQAVLRHGLQHGDRVAVGTCVLTFLDGGAARPTQGQPTVTLSDEFPAAITTEREPVPLDRMDSRRLSILCEISKTLLDQSTVKQLVESAASALIRELHAASVVVGLTRDPENHADHLIVYPPSVEMVTLSVSILRRAMSSGRSLLIVDTRLDPALTRAQSIVESGIRSAICVPLTRQSQVVGFLYLDSRRGDALYQEHDLEFVSAVGGLVGVALENARLRESELAKERMEAELAAARRMQQIILPSRWPCVPGWEIEGRHTSCREIGGDYYDAFPAPDGRLWLLIADVCGKGAGAALLASAVHAGLHALAGTCDTPFALLFQLNQLLRQRDLGSSFVTCLAILGDLRTGQMTLCSAGHPGPLRVRPDGSATEVELPTAFALGVFPDALLQEGHIEIQNGESLLLYTDGAADMLDPKGDQFGEGRLCQLLASRCSQPIGEVLSDIETTIAAFRGSREPCDDLTLLMCRRGQAETIPSSR